MNELIVPFDWRNKVPVILLSGPSASGKDMAVNALSDKISNVYVFSSGNYLRERIGKEYPTDDELYQFGKGLQEQHGEEAFAKLMAEEAQKLKEEGKINAAIFNGVRRFKEYEWLRDEFGALPLYLDANPWLRICWRNRRNLEKGLAKVLPKDFLAAEANQLPELDKIKKSIGVQYICNDGSIDELAEKVLKSVGRTYPGLI